MKYLFFVFILIFSASVFANNHIKNWVEVSGLSQQDVIDVLEEQTIYNYFLNDDGGECNGDVYDYELSSIETLNKKIKLQLVYKYILTSGGHPCYGYNHNNCQASLMVIDGKIENLNLECEY